MAFPVQPFLAVLDNEYENDDDSNNIDDEKYQEPCKKMSQNIPLHAIWDETKD